MDKYKVWIGNDGPNSDGELWFCTVSAHSANEAIARIEPTLGEHEFISYAECAYDHVTAGEIACGVE